MNTDVLVLHWAAVLKLVCMKLNIFVLYCSSVQYQVKNWRTQVWPLDKFVSHSSILINHSPSNNVLLDRFDVTDIHVRSSWFGLTEPSCLCYFSIWGKSLPGQTCLSLLSHQRCLCYTHFCAGRTRVGRNFLTPLPPPTHTHTHFWILALHFVSTKILWSTYISQSEKRIIHIDANEYDIDLLVFCSFFCTFESSCCEFCKPLDVTFPTAAFFFIYICTNMKKIPKP